MISADILIILQTSVLLFIVTIVIFYKWRFTYWKKKNIPGPTPSIPFGNLQNILTRKTTSYQHTKTIYDQMKSQKVKHCGVFVFTSPAYMLLDPEYIKNITCKDFNHFVNRGMYHNEEVDPLSAHLLSLEDEKWKNLRAKLTPIFTSGKMKMMFNSLINCAEQMLEAMQKLKAAPLDIREICACYTTDVIGTCAFGLDCNSFKGEAEFRRYGKKALHPSIQNVIRIIFCSMFTNLAKFFKTRLIDAEVSAFFIDAIRTTLRYRENNGINRNDFLQLSLQMKQRNELTVEEIAAQAFIFFLAGFETSSTTMSCCVYELARNEGVQKKLREEIGIILAKHEGRITYESISEMKYLGQVIEETLRIYPPIPQVQRICTKEYKLSDHDAVLEKGTPVILPIFALHRDQEYYPDPEKFDPDRFSEENKLKRHPFAYLPFGEGPRICIGTKNVSFIIPIEGAPDKYLISIGREVTVITWNGIDDKICDLEKVAEVDVQEDALGNRINDAKCDASGRLWCGTMGPEPQYGHIEPKKGTLYSMEPNGQVKAHVNPVSISNGLAWSLDNTKLYYIDSTPREIYQYNFDLKAGTISDKKVIFSFREAGIRGFPDGQTIDADGNLWVAVFDAYKVIKINPNKYNCLLQTVHIPAKKVTSVAFGGPNLDELYVTSASFTEDDIILAPPNHGALFKVTGLGVKGLPAVKAKIV